jgi:RNA polymerase sigma factor (sigma-70 family)
MDDVPPGAPADDLAASRARDAQWVEAALAGDQQAFGRLYDAWFDRVFNLARGVVRDDEVAAEVAQDAFLSAWKNLATLENTDAFGGWLLRIARNASFNRQKKEARSRPVDDEGMSMIEQVGSSPVSAPSGFGVEDRLSRLDDPEQFVADAEMVALVRESAATLGERDAEVLDLQLRYGMSPAEIGEVIGVNRNAANQLCHRIRKRFATAVQARVLWNGSRPACDQLDALLTSAGVTRFDAEAVRLADKHAPDCEQCSERRELRLQPAAMFASVPLLAAPVLLKAKTAAALEGAGVPMGGSAHAATSGAGAHVAISLGDGRTIEDGPGDDDAPADVSTGAHPVRRALVMGGVALVLVLLAVGVLLAERPDEGLVDGEVATEAGESTSTSRATSTTQTPTSQPVEAGDTVPDSLLPPGESTTVPPTAVDPGPAFPDPLPPDPNDPPPTTTPLRVSFVLSDPTPGNGWIMIDPGAPTLEWSVAGGGAASVRLRPPSVDNQPSWGSATALTGSMVICPGQNSGSSCSAAAGVHRYFLDILDGQGRVMAIRNVTLTI